MIEFRNLQVLYDDAIEAVRDVSLQADKGALVALLGSNGAGKSTMLKAMSGILYAEEGKIDNGSIHLEGADISAFAPDEIVRRGVVHVPEGRRVFPALTVEENLQVGGFTTSAAVWRERRDQAFELFPRLAERRDQIAGYMSGGEQQMLAIGRALVAQPRLLMLDEPSLGLAPKVVTRIFECIDSLRREDTAILLVEQNARKALKIADRGYVLSSGRIVMEGAAETLLKDPEIFAAYLGSAQ